MVRKVIKTMRKSDSGLRNISYDDISNTGPKGEIISSLFNKILSEAMWPSQW